MYRSSFCLSRGFSKLVWFCFAPSLAGVAVFHSGARFYLLTHPLSRANPEFVSNEFFLRRTALYGAVLASSGAGFYLPTSPLSRMFFDAVFFALSPALARPAPFIVRHYSTEQRGRIVQPMPGVVKGWGTFLAISAS